MLRWVLTLVAAISLVSSPASAVEPDEVLDDPQLELRARDISKGLRCLQCQNQSIDDSNADIAKDLRLVVRERLVAGDTDDEVVDYVVARYGEFVLLNPVFALHTLVLWLLGPFLLIIGGFVLWRFRQSSKTAASPQGLSEQERALLEKIQKTRLQEDTNGQDPET